MIRLVDEEKLGVYWYRITYKSYKLLDYILNIKNISDILKMVNIIFFVANMWY